MDRRLEVLTRVVSPFFYVEGEEIIEKKRQDKILSWLHKADKDLLCQIAHTYVDMYSALVFEWILQKKRLTLFFDVSGCFYLRSWGVHMENDMEYRRLDLPEELTKLWEWLLT